MSDTGLIVLAILNFLVALAHAVRFVVTGSRINFAFYVLGLAVAAWVLP